MGINVLIKALVVHQVKSAQIPIGQAWKTSESSQGAGTIFSSTAILILSSAIHDGRKVTGHR
jgi:hypothetical protein